MTDTGRNFPSQYTYFNYRIEIVKGCSIHIKKSK